MLEKWVKYGREYEAIFIFFEDFYLKALYLLVLWWIEEKEKHVHFSDTHSISFDIYIIDNLK